MFHLVALTLGKIVRKLSNDFLAQFPAQNRVPIVMISASKDIDKSARESGADDFLAKPFEIDELLDLVIKYSSQPKQVH